nr:hypothetical protein 11 [Desulfobacterales bacterium]
MKISSMAISPGRPYRPKPFCIPKDFILVVDTREQKPLFTSVDGLSVCREALQHGDYSIKGFEDRFTIERKQVSDFYSYIGRERHRTIKKLEKLSQLDFAGMVIESSADDLMVPPIYSRVSPESARQFLVSVNVRYGIHVYCDRCRVSLERWVLDRAIKFYRLQREAI